MGEAVRDASEDVAADCAAGEGDCLDVAVPFMTLRAVAGWRGVVGLWSALAVDGASVGRTPFVAGDCEAIGLEE